MGNLVDRVRLGYVVDFIDVGVWPVFNIADSAIVVGLIGLFWTLTSAKGRVNHRPEPTGESVLLPMTLAEKGVPDSEMETTSVADNSVSEKREKPWE